MSTIRDLERQVARVVNDFSTRKLLIVEYHGGRLIERSTGLIVPPAVARGGAVRTICTNRGLIASPPLTCQSGQALKLSEPPPLGSLAALWCLAGGLDCPRHQNGFRCLPWCGGSGYFRWIASVGSSSKDRWLKDAARIWSFAVYQQDLSWQSEQRRASDHLSAWQERYEAGVTALTTDTPAS